MKYLAIFKELLGTLECPVHHQKPEIVEGDNGELQINCCCPKFKKECLFIVNKIVTLTAKKS